MQDLSKLSDQQLIGMLKSYIDSNYSVVLLEYLNRRVKKVDRDLESVNELHSLGICQGSKAQLKDIISIFTPLPTQGTVPAE